MTTPKVNVEQLLHAALAELHPMARVSGALSSLEPTGEVHLIAIGKAAPAMTRGALMAWGGAISKTLVVTSDDTDESGLPVLRAGHPLPDQRSVDAAEECLLFAAAAPSLLVLVSGGASSLVCAPVDGVTLAMKQRVTRALIRSGAPIAEVNIVRKHLSRIKGGGLARAAGDAPVFTLIVSDVVRGAPEDVGSGPSVADASTVKRARKIVDRWAPELGALPFAKTGKVKNSVGVKVVVAPQDLARAMSSRLRQRGIKVDVRDPSDAKVEKLASEYLTAAAAMKPGEAIVRVAEPSVVVPPDAKGRGGRSTHLAALVGKDLPAGFQFAALATDGVDGTSDTGGAIVNGNFRDYVDETALERALADLDTGPLHLQAGTAVDASPTGHNLADLHVLVRQ